MVLLFTLPLAVVMLCTINCTYNSFFVSIMHMTQAKRFHGTRRNEGILAVLELAKAQASFARKANAAWKQASCLKDEKMRDGMGWDGWDVPRYGQVSVLD